MSHSVSWDVTFADKTHASSQGSSWDSFSAQEAIDGVVLHLSKQPISQISVAAPGNLCSLIMEDPQKCFGFHRWRTAVGSGQSEWLYSAFGYLTDESRIILQVTQTSGRMLVQKRSTAFVL